MELEKIGTDDLYIVDGDFNVNVVWRQGEFTTVAPKLSTTYMYIAKTEPSFTFRLSEQEKKVIEDDSILPYMKYDVPLIHDVTFMDYSRGHRYLLVKNGTTMKQLLKKRDRRIADRLKIYTKAVAEVVKMISKVNRELDKEFQRLKKKR